MTFQPTCPRCANLCDHDARYCVECGTRLHLTADEIAELRRPKPLLKVVA